MIPSNLRALSRIACSLIPLFVVLTAASAAMRFTIDPARITLVQGEEDSGASEPPAITDEQKQGSA
jgi:hypothetical protein